MREMIEVTGQWIVLAAAVAGACGVLLRVVRAVWRRFKLMGDRMEILGKVIDRELTTNGGGSMKDMLGTIHDDLASLSLRQQEEFDEIRGRLADHGAKLAELNRKVDDHEWRLARMEKGEVDSHAPGG